MNLQQDLMESSRTISHLAAANQQLAAAHNLTIANLQWLYSELKDVERREKFRALCPNCRRRENDISIGKSRRALGKQSIAVKSNNKRSRKLRKLPAFDESESIDTECTGNQEIEDGLRKEIYELNIFNLEAQKQNDRLTNDLEQQRLVIERLTKDFEDSRQECKTKEKSLEQVSQKLNRFELESAKLQAELETFQCERRSTERLVREQVEKSTALRAKIAEQDEEKIKQLQALDEATQQIHALELAVKACQSAKPDPSVKEDSELTKSEDLKSNPDLSVVNEEFKKELMLKREARQRAIAAISAEMDNLRKELEAEKEAHLETVKQLENLKDAQIKAAAKSKTDNSEDWNKTDEKTSERIEALRLSDLLKISDEVMSNLWLQLERTDDLRFQLENEPEEHRLRIRSLNRLSEETRATLQSRKQQVNAIKDKLAQILVRLGDRRFLLDSDEIKEEAERQIKDIARTRNLCDERSRILVELKDHCFKEMHELKLKLESSRSDNQSLEEELRKAEDKMDTQDAEILNLESQLGLAKADCRDLQNQMSVINSLFTQMLLSASSAEMDLDRLTRLLQENHDLISDMAKENGTEAAALPKLLLDIIEQVDGRSRENQEKKEEDSQEENIAHNLPKVWRVLLELLSCHAAGTPGANSTASAAAESSPDSCYKSVDTPTGPRLVISVSKTYIRLKELILEKKHLEKEMNRMKQLNTHLESKLSEQEKRLSTVSDELSKTWNIVGRMQAQHQQLHTHEKILRYELQQKRKMLQELKQELEYCREKWESARQKNTNTEIEWRSLRREFAARKAHVTHADSFNNSGESGFSDEREEESDEDEDEEEVGKRIRPINSRRRQRKDGTRAVTSDTESEQPTDTELSECKTASSSTSGQRTPTPETEAELESSEIPEEDPAEEGKMSENLPNAETEILDPLDKALTNVIQKLIITDERNFINTTSDTSITNIDSVSEHVASEKSNVPHEIESLKDENAPENSINSIVPIMSVFTIGPVPSQMVPVKNVQFSNPLVVGPSNKILENITEENTNLAECTLNEKDKISSKVIDLPFEVDNSSVDSSSSLETVKELSNNKSEKGPSVSSESRLSCEFPSTEILDARAARLRSLEEQAEWLVKKVSDTNRRGSVLNSRLEELHETYGSMPTAPPMPDVLPTFRLQSELNEVAPQNNSDDYQMSLQTNDTSGKETYKDRAPQ